MAKLEKRFDRLQLPGLVLGEKVHAWLDEVGSRRHFRSWVDPDTQELVVQVEGEHVQAP
jgi:hypothetical protein